MKKRGFTLVELLAVIAILAILVIIALPNIMSLFNEAKKNSFINELKNIHKTVEEQWMNDSLFETNEVTYCRVGGVDCQKAVKLSGRQELDYYIKVNKIGSIVEYYATDGTYQYEYQGLGLKIEDITNVTPIASITDPSKILVITSSGSNGGSSGGNGSSVTTGSFASDDWATIIAAVRTNNTSSYNVGDTKEVNLGSLGTHTLRIANKSTPASCSTSGFSQTACGFVLEFSDIINTHRMNSNRNGGWQGSELRTYINSTIYNSLPSELKSGIISTTVVSSYDNGGEYGPNYVTNDNLYLLATHEIWQDDLGNPHNGIENFDTSYNNTRQLDYYSSQNVTLNNPSGAIKRINGTASIWWTRSMAGVYNWTDSEGMPNSDAFFGDYFYVLSNGASEADESATSNYGVSPAFRIG